MVCHRVVKNYGKELSDSQLELSLEEGDSNPHNSYVDTGQKSAQFGDDET